MNENLRKIYNWKKKKIEKKIKVRKWESIFEADHKEKVMITAKLNLKNYSIKGEFSMNYR